MLPEPGTSLASAIETATAAFIEKEKKYKVLLLSPTEKTWKDKWTKPSGKRKNQR